MRFVVIQGVVLNTDAIDMIVPQGDRAEVTFRNGSIRLFDLSTEELLEHLREKGDDIERVAHDASNESAA